MLCSSNWSVPPESMKLYKLITLSGQVLPGSKTQRSVLGQTAGCRRGTHGQGWQSRFHEEQGHSHSREDGKNTPIHQSTVYNDIQGGVSWGGESSHCSEMPCSLLLESRTCQIYPVPFSTRMYNHGLLLKQKSYKNVMGKLGERRGYRNVSTS